MAWVDAPEITDGIGRASLIRGILNNINILKNTVALELFNLDYNSPFTVNSTAWMDSGRHSLDIELFTTAMWVTFTMFWVRNTSYPFFQVDILLDGESVSLEQGTGDEWANTNHSYTVTVFLSNLTPGIHTIDVRFRLGSSGSTGIGYVHGVSYLSVIGL